MNRYSLVFFDSAHQVIEDRRASARDVGQALAQANRRLCSGLRRADGRLDPKGRVDVLDGGGATVARIYCAEVIAAIS